MIHSATSWQQWNPIPCNNWKGGQHHESTLNCQWNQMFSSWQGKRKFVQFLTEMAIISSCAPRNWFPLHSGPLRFACLLWGSFLLGSLQAKLQMDSHLITGRKIMVWWTTSTSFFVERSSRGIFPLPFVPWHCPHIVNQALETLCHLC